MVVKICKAKFKVVEKMFCTRCKGELPDGAIYCLYCGKKQVVEHTEGRAKKRANGTGTVYRLAGRRRKPWIAAKKKSVIGYYETKKRLWKP